MNDKKYAAFVHAKSDPAVFFCAVFLVFDREHAGVKEDLRSTLETDFVIAQVPSGFRWVPFKIISHGFIPPQHHAERSIARREPQVNR